MRPVWSLVFSERSARAVGILVTCLESGTDIAWVRPWNEREGPPHRGVQKAEAQFKVAASVPHVTAHVQTNIRPVESSVGFLP
jgi:hypothetical protein